MKTKFLTKTSTFILIITFIIVTIISTFFSNQFYFSKIYATDSFDDLQTSQSSFNNEQSSFDIAQNNLDSTQSNLNFGQSDLNGNTTRSSFDNANFTNLIVMMRFSDEDEFIDTVYDNISVKNLINNTYDNSEYSVRDFFYSVSNTNLRMQNLYLFLNGGSIQLTNPRGYYAEYDNLNPNGYQPNEVNVRMSQLKQDWSNAINNAFRQGAVPTDIYGNAYDFSELDKNNDGKIDAISIIYKNTTQNISVSWSSPLWNYQDSCYDVSFTKNGKTYQSDKYVQLTYNYSNNEKTLIYTDTNGTQFLSQSTACHEMSHIFGLLDLYNSQQKSPIYYMSLMGKHLSPVAQFMTIKERESLGFVNSTQLKTITNQGEYILDVTSSTFDDNKILGYKLDLPSLDKTLYLEYRKFDGTQNKYDSQSKVIYTSTGEKLKNIYIKSGLVCYLAKKDIRFPTNLGTNSSNWNFVALGGTYETKTDCALTLNDYIEITDNLYIEVVNVSNNQLTFSITGSDLTPPTNTHTAQHFERVEPTCYSFGNIEYYYCTDCQKYFLDKNEQTEITAEDTIIPKIEHTIVTLPYVAPTCTQDGLTQGSACTVCDEIITIQTTINKLGHSPSDWITDSQATTEHEGQMHKECTRCSTILEIKTIDKLPSIIDPDPTPDNPNIPTDPDTPSTDPDNPNPDNPNPDNPTLDPDSPTTDDSNQNNSTTSNLTPVIITIFVISFITYIPICIILIKRLKRKKHRPKIILK